MSPEQLVAVIGAIAALVTAVGILVSQVAGFRRQLDGRLSELVEATRAASLKEGELQGRDHQKAETEELDAPPIRTNVPE